MVAGGVGVENNSFLNLTLLFNLTGGTWGVNQSNTSVVGNSFVNGTPYNFSISGLDDGIYTWACIAYNNAKRPPGRHQNGR